MVTIQQELRQTKPFASKAAEAAVSLVRTADLVRRNVAAVLEPHGLTGQQYNVLRILRGAGEAGLPTLDIADRMIEETPGITRLLDRLEAKQLVSRERCPTDRRQVFCRIRPEGLHLLAELDAPLEAAESSSLAGLKKRELDELVRVLDLARESLHTTIAQQRALNVRRAETNQPNSRRNR